MQKQNFVFVTGSPRRTARSLVFTLIILATGILLIGAGLACLLFAPLLIAAGAALVVFALLVVVMLLLLCGLCWILVRLIEALRQLAFTQALSPALHALLRHLARQLVAFLLEWLDQGSGQPCARARRPGKRHRRRRPLLALGAP